MKKRTTVTADADDLDVLRCEAERRGVSLNELVSEAVAEKAAEIQAATRPRLGIGHGGPARLAGKSVSDEEASNESARDD